MMHTEAQCHAAGLHLALGVVGHQRHRFVSPACFGRSAARGAVVVNLLVAGDDQGVAPLMPNRPNPSATEYKFSALCDPAGCRDTQPSLFASDRLTLQVNAEKAMTSPGLAMLRRPSRCHSPGKTRHRKPKVCDRPSQHAELAHFGLIVAAACLPIAFA
jgi:hypothetical protein